MSEDHEALGWQEPGKRKKCRHAAEIGTTPRAISIARGEPRHRMYLFVRCEM